MFLLSFVTKVAAELIFLEIGSFVSKANVLKQSFEQFKLGRRQNKRGLCFGFWRTLESPDSQTVWPKLQTNAKFTWRTCFIANITGQMWFLLGRNSWWVYHSVNSIMINFPSRVLYVRHIKQILHYGFVHNRNTWYQQVIRFTVNVTHSTISWLFANLLCLTGGQQSEKC